MSLSSCEIVLFLDRLPVKLSSYGRVEVRYARFYNNIFTYPGGWVGGCVIRLNPSSSTEAGSGLSWSIVYFEKSRSTYFNPNKHKNLLNCHTGAVICKNAKLMDG